MDVSNPIREYLQIQAKEKEIHDKWGFKPYKGVSSNILLQFLWTMTIRFKPYKGVSSNKYKIKNGYCCSNVSNPIREYLQMIV